MDLGREITRPLGVVLVERGLVSHEDVDSALAVQIETNQPLGEILLEQSLIARPMLAKALAAQRGRLLEEEGGFGSGLMAKIEHLHMRRRGIDPGAGGHAATADDPEGQVLPFAFPEEEEQEETSPEFDEYARMRERKAELDRRERELSRLAASLARKERKIKRDATKAASPKPVA
jgi:hypothetical protein